MTLKAHKNLIANGAAVTRLACWRRGDLVCFGLVNPDTLPISEMPGENMLGEKPRGRDQQHSSIERQFGAYLLRHQ
jgi:hypothetical protein